jgi:hypothetical protein
MTQSSVNEDGHEEPTIRCPFCLKEIHEDAPRCPHCGNYPSDREGAPSRKPWWIAGGVVVCLYLVYRWIVGW